MDFRSVAVAVAGLIATGAGQAGAATVETHDAWFTISSLSAWCWGSCDAFPDSETKYFGGLRQGQTASGTLSLTKNGDGDSIGLSFSFGSPKVGFSGILNLLPNGTFLYDNIDEVLCCYREWATWNGETGVWRLETDGGHVDQLVTVNFELAAVPLPASAALLPISLGAFAMLRKRRKQS